MNRRGMFEAKDPGIKLFGKTIPLPENQIPVMSTAGSQIPLKSELMTACNGITEVEGEDFISEDGKLSKTSALECVTHEGQTPFEVNGVKLNSRPTEDEAETDSTGEEKVLKKPDKIIPCPRCNSLDTKFCYFNNYNVNQPRHFCKNCQRYWTAGGTMRNVPVGAGRRKNKHLAPQYRQLIVSSDGVPSTEVANHRLFSCGESSTSFNPSSENTMVFKFGVEPNLCESMGTVLNLAERRRRSVNGGEHGEESSSCASSTTSSSYRENELPSKVIQRTEGNLTGSFNNVVSPHPPNFYPTPPWVFSCGQGWNNGAPMMATHCSSELVYVPETSNLNSVQWCSSPMVAVPGFCAPNTPLQFVPAPYWGWNMMPGSAGCPSPSSSTSNSCSGNGSATLGKHSRDPNLRDDERLEKGILAPKTLRIDDQDEASKNPVWATLGIKPEQKDLPSRCDSFRDHEQPAEGTQILEANPAALSRFRTFQEST